MKSIILLYIGINLVISFKLLFVKRTPHPHVLSPSYNLQVLNIANFMLSRSRLAPLVYNLD